MHHGREKRFPPSDSRVVIPGGILQHLFLLHGGGRSRGYRYGWCFHESHIVLFFLLLLLVGIVVVMADASSLAGKPQSPFHRIKCRTVPQSPAPDESGQRKPCVIRHKPGDQKRIPRHEVDEPGIASFFIITVFGVDDMSTEVPGKHGTSHQDKSALIHQNSSLQVKQEILLRRTACPCIVTPGHLPGIRPVFRARLEILFVHTR
nr:MAG TPA: hypothetical protein [Bacteriophage sp.]